MPSSSETETRRPRATILGAFLEGWRRTLRAPGVAFGVWSVTTLLALPLAAVVHDDITAHLGSSLVAEQAASGWDLDWTGEFGADARGVSATLTREILGATGVVATLSRILSGDPLPASIVGAVTIYLIITTFLSGGIVDRLARARRVGFASFVSLCGRYFFRLTRLAIGLGLVYWGLYRFLHPLLFETLFDRWTRDLSNEPQGLSILAALFVVYALVLGAVSLIGDFTRVRLVVEDRRSVLSALGAAVRFVRRRFWRCCGLYGLNIVGQVVLARLWLQVAIGGDGPDVWALLLAQVYLVVRIWARMAFLGSEVVFYQGELAHATYTAAALPQWPDSPSVEAIRNLRRG